MKQRQREKALFRDPSMIEPWSLICLCSFYKKGMEIDTKLNLAQGKQFCKQSFNHPENFSWLQQAALNRIFFFSQ